MGETARKIGDAAANAVLRVVDSPRTLRQAIDRREREIYAHGKVLPKGKK